MSEISLTVSEDERQINVPKQCPKKYQKIQTKEENTTKTVIQDSRKNWERRPQYNQEPRFGRERLSYKRGPLSSRLGGPHRELSNMRKQPKAKHNALEKRKRLTIPSMRSQPSLSERIGRNKKHATLKTSSDESESSKNNCNKTFKTNREKLRNHSQNGTEVRRTYSPAPK